MAIIKRLLRLGHVQLAEIACHGCRERATMTTPSGKFACSTCGYDENPMRFEQCFDAVAS